MDNRKMYRKTTQYFFTMSDTGLRGHKLKMYKPQVHLDIRKHFVFNNIEE